MVLEQSSSLVLINREGERVTLNVGELHDRGNHTLVGYRQFKEDDETWLATFDGLTAYGKVTVEVSYLSGVNGLKVYNVDLTRIPHGLEVETTPAFNFNEDEDEIGGYDY